MGILISHSHMVANFRYKTSWLVLSGEDVHKPPLARAHRGRTGFCTNQGGLPGFALQRCGYLASMALTQAPSQAEMQLCLQEKTCMHLSNLVSASPEPSLQSSRQDQPHPRLSSAPVLATRPCLPWRKPVLVGHSSPCPKVEVQMGQ